MIYAIKLFCFFFFSLWLENIRPRGIEPISGKFRVRYNDGRISQRMWFSTALDYASIFGGKVIFHKLKT